MFQVINQDRLWALVLKEDPEGNGSTWRISNLGRSEDGRNMLVRISEWPGSGRSLSTTLRRMAGDYHVAIAIHPGTPDSASRPVLGSLFDRLENQYQCIRRWLSSAPKQSLLLRWCERPGKALPEAANDGLRLAALLPVRDLPAPQMFRVLREHLDNDRDLWQPDAVGLGTSTVVLSVKPAPGCPSFLEYARRIRAAGSLAWLNGSGLPMEALLVRALEHYWSEVVAGADLAGILHSAGSITVTARIRRWQASEQPGHQLIVSSDERQPAIRLLLHLWPDHEGGRLAEVRIACAGLALGRRDTLGRLAHLLEKQLGDVVWAMQLLSIRPLRLVRSKL